MDPRQHHQANRAAWNEAARRYECEVEADIAFLRAGGKSLLAPELRFLHDLGQCFPSYWLVRAGRLPVDGHAWGTTGWLVVLGWAVVLAALAGFAYRRDTNRV